MDSVMRIIFECLPTPTIPGPYFAHKDDGMCLERSNNDRISALSDLLLSEIVTRLPLGDGVRSTVLSRRWRGIWSSTPLSLEDSHFLRWDVKDRIQIISRIMLRHPGPFKSFRLTNTPFDLHKASLEFWTTILANKGVEDLVLLNIPLPRDLPLPQGLLRCTCLRRLYLALFEFPSTKRCNTVFYQLKELGLCHILMKAADLSFMTKSSPALEKLLMIVTSMDVISLTHSTLSCLILWLSKATEVSVRDTPQMDRIILWRSFCSGSKMNIKLSNTHLRVLGYLDPSAHNLVIAGKSVKSGMRVSQDMKITSLRILGVKVSLNDQHHSKLFATYLKCFPNMDTLHIESTHSSGKRALQFWEQMPAIESIDESIKILYLHEFGGDNCEIAFLKFILARANLLEKIVLVLSPQSDHAQIQQKLDDLGRCERASWDPQLLVSVYIRPMNFHMACDLSVRDPFYCMDNLVVEECEVLQPAEVMASNEESELLQQVSEELPSNESEVLQPAEVMASNEESELLRQVSRQAEMASAVMLNSGHLMPMVGLDMSQLAYDMERSQFVDLISTAISIGYRHFDCTCRAGGRGYDAHVRTHVISSISSALQQGLMTGALTREEIFLSAKVSYSRVKDKGPEDLIELCSKQLQDLNLEYLDLYVIYFPQSFDPDADDFEFQVKAICLAMETLVSRGLVRSLGISTFKPFLPHMWTTLPAIMKINRERSADLDFYESHGIHVIADTRDSWWICLMGDPLVKGLAEQYGKTSAQLVFRWCIQRRMLIMWGLSRVRPADREGFLKENLDIFGFTISVEDMETIKTTSYRYLQ